MDKFYKSIKFVNLLEQNSSCYLTACEDKKTVNLVRKNDWGGCAGAAEAPKGAEWRLKWVQDSTGRLTGKFRLHSIYYKVLSVRREGGWPGYLKVYQDSLPNDRDTAIEWGINFKQVNYNGAEMEAQLVIEYEQVKYFLTGPQSVMCNYERILSPRVEFLKSSCQKSMYNWRMTQLFNTEQQLQKRKQKQLDASKKLNSAPAPAAAATTNNSNSSLPVSTTTTVSRQVGVVTSGFGYNGQTNQLTGWQVGQMVVNYFSTGVGVGGGLSHYNSGQNVNGSGTQNNGAVNVKTDLGSTRDMSVNFISNKT